MRIRKGLTVTRIFDGRLNVHYGQAYVLPRHNEGMDLEDAFRGQSNGLCGAALLGSLLLITGLHTGHVGIVIDVLNEQPELDPTWEDFVEVSFQVGESPVALEDWNGETVTLIPLSAGSYRVRYCAKNMDKGHEVDTILEDEETVDFYCLAFWPEAASEDFVIKQTSEQAAYWHNWVKTL
jgi:hypothetical protein